MKIKNQEDKVLCQTPTPGKKPTRIDLWKYSVVRNAILQVLPTSGEGILFKELPELVSECIEKKMREKIGSVSWYTTTVKLDLECKKRIARVKNSSPQRLIKLENST